MARIKENTVGDGLRWYPVYTAARAEKKVYERLQQQGIESWLPLQRTLKQWSDRKKWVEEPLFRSYVFVRVVKSDLSKVLQVPGAARLIYFSGKPAAIREDQILTLKRVIQGTEKYAATQEHFEAGNEVVITAGPFAGTKGEIVAWKGQRIFFLRLMEINYNLIVEIDPSILRKVK
jgi:transcriptional antiterminator RfaH